MTLIIVRLIRPVDFKVEGQDKLSQILYGMRNQLLDNGVSSIQEFVDVQPALVLDGMVDDFNRGTIQLDKTEIIAPTKGSAVLEKRNYLKQMLYKLQDRVGGDENFAISTYRFVLGQRKPQRGEVYKNKYHTGCFAFTPIAAHIMQCLMDFVAIPAGQNNNFITIHTGINDNTVVFERETDLMSVSPDSDNSDDTTPVGKMTLSIGAVRLAQGADPFLKSLNINFEGDGIDIKQVQENMRLFLEKSVYDRLAVVGISETQLSIGDKIYPIPELNRSRVVADLSKLLLKLDAKVLGDQTTIANLVSVLSKCDEEVAKNLVDVLSKCDVRTAGVLLDILATLLKIPAQQEQLRKDVADFVRQLHQLPENKLQGGYVIVSETLSEKFGNNSLAQKIKKQILDYFEKTGHPNNNYYQQTLSPFFTAGFDDRTEMLLFLARFGKEAVAKVDGIFSAIDVPQEQNKSVGFFLECSSEVRTEIVKALSDSKQPLVVSRDFEILASLERQGQHDTALALLSYIADSKYKQEDVAKVIGFLEGHPTSLQEKTFLELRKTSISDVVAAIDKVTNPRAKTKGWFGRAVDGIRNIFKSKKQKESAKIAATLIADIVTKAPGIAAVESKLKESSVVVRADFLNKMWELSAEKIIAFKDIVVEQQLDIKRMVKFEFSSELIERILQFWSDHSDQQLVLSGFNDCMTQVLDKEISNDQKQQAVAYALNHPGVTAGAAINEKTIAEVKQAFAMAQVSPAVDEGSAADAPQGSAISQAVQDAVIERIGGLSAEQAKALGNALIQVLNSDHLKSAGLINLEQQNEVLNNANKTLKEHEMPESEMNPLLDYEPLRSKIVELVLNASTQQSAMELAKIVTQSAEAIVQMVGLRISVENIERTLQYRFNHMQQIEVLSCFNGMIADILSRRDGEFISDSVTNGRMIAILNFCEKNPEPLVDEMRTFAGQLADICVATKGKIALSPGAINVVFDVIIKMSEKNMEARNDDVKAIQTIGSLVGDGVDRDHLVRFMIREWGDEGNFRADFARGFAVILQNLNTRINLHGLIQWFLAIVGKLGIGSENFAIKLFKTVTADNVNMLFEVIKSLGEKSPKSVAIADAVLAVGIAVNGKVSPAVMQDVFEKMRESSAVAEDCQRAITAIAEIGGASGVAARNKLVNLILDTETDDSATSIAKVINDMKNDGLLNGETPFEKAVRRIIEILPEESTQNEISRGRFLRMIMMLDANESQRVMDGVYRVCNKLKGIVPLSDVVCLSAASFSPSTVRLREGADRASVFTLFDGEPLNLLKIAQKFLPLGLFGGELAEKLRGVTSSMAGSILETIKVSKGKISDVAIASVLAKMLESDKVVNDYLRAITIIAGIDVALEADRDKLISFITALPNVKGAAARAAIAIASGFAAILNREDLQTRIKTFSDIKIISFKAKFGLLAIIDEMASRGVSLENMSGVLSLCLVQPETPFGYIVTNIFYGSDGSVRDKVRDELKQACIKALLTVVKEGQALPDQDWGKLKDGLIDLVRYNFDTKEVITRLNSDNCSIKDIRDIRWGHSTKDITSSIAGADTPVEQSVPAVPEIVEEVIGQGSSGIPIEGGNKASVASGEDLQTRDPHSSETLDL